MSATVITLPIIARPNPEEAGKRALRITLDRVTLGRIKARAAHWNVTPEEAAALMLTEMLRPKGRKG